MADANTPEKADGRSLSPRMIAAIVVGVLALVFVFQNHEKGDIDFLFWTISMPAWIWLLITFVAGAAVGSLFPWFRRRRND